MKKQLIGLAASLAFATSLVLAQSADPKNSPAQAKMPAPEVVLTGCIVQGSGPTVFLLDNARPQSDKVARGRTYRLESVAEDLDFHANLNKEVDITGVAEQKPAPASGQKVAEKDLPKLSARSVAVLSDKCTTVSGQ